MFLYSLDINVKERLRKQYRRAHLEFLREVRVQRIAEALSSIKHNLPQAI